MWIQKHLMHINPAVVFMPVIMSITFLSFLPIWFYWTLGLSLQGKCHDLPSYKVGETQAYKYSKQKPKKKKKTKKTPLL